MEVKLNEHKALRGIMELASCNCITKQIWNTEGTLLSNWVVPEKIHPHRANNNNPPPFIQPSYTN